LEGQLFREPEGGLWKVRKLTVAENPAGFFLVHLMHGKDVRGLREALVLGPREWAALIRERDLREADENGGVRAEE